MDGQFNHRANVQQLYMRYLTSTLGMYIPNYEYHLPSRDKVHISPSLG